MKRITLSLIAGLALVGFVSGALAAGPSKEALALKAAETWLALVDNGQYQQSWSEAATLFRKAVPKKEWNRILKAGRGPLGAVVSRKLIDATHRTSLPGAPDGEYVVIRLDTAFTNKKSAVETITPMLDSDGHWRISGYFIK